MASPKFFCTLWPVIGMEEYKEMIPDAAETVLGYFGFDRSVYSNTKKGRRKWYEELKEQRARDIEIETI
jgi:GTPase SAR1 family protein